MTLVAAILHEGVFSFVGDTKVTWNHDALRTADLYTEARVKIVLLREDLAVAVAGDAPQELIEDLEPMRSLSAGALIQLLQYKKRDDDQDRDYLVASLEDMQLWRVCGPEFRVDEVPAGQLAGIGDMQAFAVYEAAVMAGPAEEMPIRMTDAMAALVINPAYPSVGGYVVSAASAPEGFRFVLSGVAIAPEVVAEVSQPVSGGPTILTLEAPAGPSDWHAAWVLPGAGKTPFAVGLHFDEAGVGLLFRQGAFHKPEKVLDVPRPLDFAKKADAEHGHTLVVPIFLDETLT